MFKRFLVPLDGSILAETALKPALQLAQRANGTVYLVRIPIYVDGGAQISPEYQRVWTADDEFPEHEEVNAYLRKTQDQLQQSGVAIRTIIGEGEPSEAILNLAFTKNIDLIVMASHGRSGLSRWLLGSVSSQVIRKARIPVMLVRYPAKFKHLLLTLDGSEMAEHAIQPAVEFALGFGSQVTVLQVKERKTFSKHDGEVGGDKPYLNKICSKYLPKELDVKTMVLEGSAKEEILAFAAQNKVDLIAMSTHGHSRLRKLFYGSVTDKVMCDSGCAMLITRLPGQELSH
jgi:nucleotide-binding universal stress UspA family protein